MKREKITGDLERRIAIGMIADSNFLRDVQPILNPDLLEVPFVRTVAEWCSEHWQKHEEAPKGLIKEIYNSKVRRKKVPESEQELIEEFLDDLDKEWLSSQFNSEFWLDEAEKYLDGQALKMLAEDIESNLQSGDHEQARSTVTEYRQIIRPTSQAINPLINVETIDDAFAEAAKPMFKLPGALGALLNPMFVRECFVGIMAPEKRGKTFFLTELAMRATRHGCNVAFFAVGDMTRRQMAMRLAVRLTGKSNRRAYCGEALVPVLDCRRNQMDTCDNAERASEFGVLFKTDGGWKMLAHNDPDAEGYEPCSNCKNLGRGKFRGAYWHDPQIIKQLSPGGAKRAGQKFVDRYGDRLRLFVYSSRELNTSIMNANLNELKEREGFVPDIIIVDYADVMGHENPQVTDPRHSVNETWMGLERLRKQWHCLVLTATQADAASYDAHDITMGNFSEDKRKLSHVTAMFAINQTRKEKRDSVARIGLVVAREMDFLIERQVKILQCLKMGRPVLDSYFIPENR